MSIKLAEPVHHHQVFYMIISAVIIQCNEKKTVCYDTMSEVTQESPYKEK